MSEEHFSLREIERRKRERNKEYPESPPSRIPQQQLDDYKEDPVNFHHYLDVIVHRKWVVLFITIVVTLSALVKSYRQKPVYIAQTQILFKEKGGGMVGGSTESSSLETLAVIGSTTPLFQKVVSSLDLKLSADDVSDMVRIKPDLNTNILDITITTFDPELAVRLANAFAKTFINHIIAIDRSEANKAHNVLKKQIEKSGRELIRVEEEIQSFINEEGLISVNAEIRTKMNQMSSLEITIREIESQLIGKEKEADQIKISLETESKTLITETRATKPLRERLIKLEMELATARTRRTDDHPAVKAILDNIESIQELIRQKLEETVQVETIGRNPVRDNLLSRLANSEATIAALTAKQVALKNLRVQLTTQMGGLPGKQIRFSRLEREKNSIENIYLELQTQFQQARIAKDTYAGNLHHLQPAEGARQVGRNVRQSGILGLIIGLIVGAGLAFFLEYLDNSIKTPMQVQKELELNTIGLIPFIDKESVIIDFNNSESILAEIYRHVHNNLHYTSYIRNQNIILVASTLRGEGSTTTTINLGISAVMQGKSVVLIDADLRRPTLSRYFGFTRRRRFQDSAADSMEEMNNDTGMAGLSDYLADEAELKHIIHKTKVPGLFFIPAGTKIPNPADILNSPKIGKLLNTLERKVDQIFIDTPAILPVVDAIILCPLAESIVFVVENRKVPIDAAKDAIRRLKQANTNIAGCIINKVHRKKSPHYYYYDDDDGMEHIEHSMIEERRNWRRRLVDKVRRKKS